jgi:hypothetical protein
MWQDLVKIGLIGTDKSTPAVLTLEKLQSWGISTDDITQAVMQGIGTYSLMRKGGFPLKKHAKDIAKPSEKEEKTYISSASIQHLREIIYGKLGDALPEFIIHAQYSDKILPPEFLPYLFHHCRGNMQLWTMVKTIIGKRGEWLLHQNSDWSHLLDSNEILQYIAPPQYSSAETVQLGQDILNLLKTTALWAADRDILMKLKNIAYHGDIGSIANLDMLLNLESHHPLKNKVQEAFKVLLFRRDMIQAFRE